MRSVVDHVAADAADSTPVPFDMMLAAAIASNIRFFCTGPLDGDMKFATPPFSSVAAPARNIDIAITIWFFFFLYTLTTLVHNPILVFLFFLEKSNTIPSLNYRSTFIRIQRNRVLKVLTVSTLSLGRVWETDNIKNK